MQNNNPVKLISVIIPLYNGAKYIHRSIKSVLEQSYTNFELVVIDDGSVDFGCDIVLDFTDPRLRLVRQENSGVSAARNRGILESQGSYIAFLDADDKWDPEFLKAMLALVEIYPTAGIYGTGYRMIFPKGPDVEVTIVEALKQDSTYLVTDYFYRASGGAIINASGVMIPSRILKELGAFKVGEHHGEDLELWARIALYYPIAYDSRILFSFYQTPINDKQRFRKLPEYDPKVLMLRNVLIGSQSYLPDHNIIGNHLNKYLTKMCLSFVLCKNIIATQKYMQNSYATTFTPLLNRLISIQFYWPFVWCIAWMYRFTKSRTMMKVIGGQRVSHRVLERLVPISK